MTQEEQAIEILNKIDAINQRNPVDTIPLDPNRPPEAIPQGKWEAWLRDYQERERLLQELDKLFRPSGGAAKSPTTTV